MILLTYWIVDESFFEYKNLEVPFLFGLGCFLLEEDEEEEVLLAEIEENWLDYVALKKMESSEAFQVMQDFVEEIEDQSTQELLYKILQRKSPFANFKAEVESSDYREQCFLLNKRPMWNMSKRN